MPVVGLCGVYICLMVKGGGVAEPIGSTVLRGAVRLPVGSGGEKGYIYVCSEWDFYILLGGCLITFSL